jgi:hypothetical protein
MEKFRIWITFENGHRHLDTDWEHQTVILDSLRRLVHGPVAAMGIIKEIKVVDMLDCTVYLIQNGNQVFPEVA